MSRDDKFIQDEVKEAQHPPRDAERFIDISGTDSNGHPKAHVILRHYEHYSDNSTQEIQFFGPVLKPIVNVFSHAGYINIYLNFGRNNDADLRMLWSMLENYSAAENSVSYLAKEIERGYYYEPDGKKHLVYYPVLELALSPVGKEGEYQIHALNPAFYNITVAELHGELCVVQLTFPEDFVTVVNDLEPIDYSELYHEVMSEMNREQN